MTAHGMTDLVVSWRAALQALPPLLHVDIALSAAQTVSATTSLTLATGRITALTHHGGFVPKVTEKEKEDICLLHGVFLLKDVRLLLRFASTSLFFCLTPLSRFRRRSLPA